MEMRVSGRPGIPAAALLGAFLCVGALASRADTIHIQIEFSGHSPQSYALTKSGSFSSGVEALTALVYSLGGAAQRFDAPYTASPLVTGNWIQWWRWDFGLSLTGMSLGGQTDGDWMENYWSIFVRESAAAPFATAAVGLAELTPADGNGMALKFSGFFDESTPADGITPQPLAFTAATDPSPPRVVSCRLSAPGVVEMIFATVPGGTYRLESADNLSPASWRAYSADFVATSHETVFTVSTASEASRVFFRLGRRP